VLGAGWKSRQLLLHILEIHGGIAFKDRFDLKRTSIEQSEIVAVYDKELIGLVNTVKMDGLGRMLGGVMR
jgi:hypothetical protein